MQLDFGKEIYARAYHNLISVCDKSFMNDGNNISLEEFKESVCLFDCDHTFDQRHCEEIHLIHQSTTTLGLMFRKPTEETISVLVYTETDDPIEIDKIRVGTTALTS